MKLHRLLISLFISVCLWTFSVQAQSFETIKKFPAEEAHQAVAVDSSHFYAIASKSIGKYDKETGQKISEWKEEQNGPILHLDSGVIVDEKLYAAHSNYPEIPMTSSVEVWDVQSLKHTASHSFGNRWGSLTWIDRHKDNWWGVFAHYEEFADDINKDNRWTTLVRFDNSWNRLESWIFPEKVLQRFDGKSNSGGSWGRDGYLYISGHDRSELYKMNLPEAGSVLELDKIISIESEGQGIAWDRSEEEVIYTIKRSSREVVVSEKH